MEAIFSLPPVHQSSKVGVHQGSVLGPLLFLIYINDFHHAFTSPCLNTHFADDTAISISEKNDEELETKLNTAFSNVLDWCSSNFIALNVSKNKFHNLRQKVKYLPSYYPSYFFKVSIINISGENDKVPWTCHWRKLIFTTHIKNLRLKISRYVGLMRRLKLCFALLCFTKYLFCSDSD